MPENKDKNQIIAIYSEQLQKGDLQSAYKFLLSTLASIKSQFPKKTAGEFSVGNIAPGYLDISYFPFYDAFLRERKLRFGIVLNHQPMRFELWLMGQNAEIQKAWWELLRETPWNKDRTEMPRYSILEVILAAEPDFNDTERLTEEICTSAVRAADEITRYLKALEQK